MTIYDDFEIITEEDTHPDATRAYDATDDFEVVGRPLSYAHSLRSGIPPSTAPVLYASSLSDGNTEEAETEGHEDADQDFNMDEIDHEVENQPNKTANATIATIAAPKVARNPSVSPQYAWPSDMTARLCDAKAELAVRLKGPVPARSVRSRGKRRVHRPTPTTQAEITRREAELARGFAPHSNSCRPYNRGFWGQVCPAGDLCLTMRIMGDTRWWAVTMARARSELAAIVGELVERGIMAPVWVSARDDAYWACMDETAHTLRALIHDGTRIPGHTSAAWRRDMGRLATTRVLALILDLAPVSGSLWILHGWVHSLCTPSMPPPEGAIVLRLALVFPAVRPVAPSALPSKDKRKVSPWHRLSREEESNIADGKFLGKEILMYDAFPAVVLGRNFGTTR